jgi:peptide/nickel transport system substrate-binding protein
MRMVRALDQPVVNRRRVLGGAALTGAGVAAATLVGCGRPGSPASTTSGSPAAKQPKRGGILVHRNGYETQGTGFDSHIVSIFFSEGYTLFYQRLLSYKANNYEIESELAQKWEQPSPTELVFTLAPNVKWHNKPPVNGRPLTVDDIVYNLERMRTDNPRFFHRSYFDLVDTIHAIDGNRVQFTLKEPDASLLTKLSMNGLVMMAPEVVERSGGKMESADKVVGTGPFIMTAVEERVGSEYVRNPDYWKPGLPYLDGLRTIQVPDDQAGWSAFLAGQLDVQPAIPGTEVKKYLSQQGKDFVPEWLKPMSVLMLYPNTKVKPFDDTRVQRALRLLIDHEDQIKTFEETFNGLGRNGLVLPPAASVWDLKHEEYYNFLEWKQPKDDAVKEALSLLSAAGFTRENPLKFEFSTAAYTVAWRAQAELVQGQWRKNGNGVVETTMKQLDVAEINRVRPARQFTYIFGGEAPGPDPSMALETQFRTGGTRNFADYSDPTVDAMIKKQRGIYNIAERKAVVRDLIIYLIDHYPGTAPSLSGKLMAAKPYVIGVKPEENLYGAQYETVWLDKA